MEAEVLVDVKDVLQTEDVEEGKGVEEDGETVCGNEEDAEIKVGNR